MEKSTYQQNIGEFMDQHNFEWVTDEAVEAFEQSSQANEESEHND